jgi:hypothetical protein
MAVPIKPPIPPVRKSGTRGATGSKTRNTLQTMTTISNLISALIIVESSGNDMAIGDNGRALGPLQIHRGVVLDVNRITGSHYRHQDMTNRAQARAVCEAYLKHYGKGCTTEQLARRWNGGPSGDRKAATETYWNKVKKQINNNTK